MALDATVYAYAAGILDGEGCIRIAKHSRSDGGLKYSARITVVNTSMALLEWFVSKFGGRIYEHHAGSENWRQCYRYEISGYAAGELCKAVLPYLVIKRRQAEIVIGFKPSVKRCTTPTSAEENDRRNEASSLNKRGPVAA
jgi:hypothetical protein